MSLRFIPVSAYFCLLWICAASPVSAAEPSDPIVVGIVHSDAYPSADSMKRSFEMALETVNGRGGAKGRPLQLVYADDGLKPRGAIGYQHSDETRAIRSLIDSGAIMLLGGYSSTNTIHTANIAEKHGIPFLVTTAADDEITKRRLKNVYRLNPPAQEYAGGLEELLINKVKPKSMVVVYEASPYGTGTAARMLSFCRENEIEILKLIPYQKDRVTPAYMERRLRRVKQNPPDVVYMVSYLDDAVLLVKTLRGFGIDSLLVGAGGGFVDPRFVEMLGDDANGVLTAALWSPELPYSGARGFHDAFFKLHSTVPDYHDAEAYAAVLVTDDVLDRAESLTPEGIRTALDDTDLGTPFGQVRFQSYEKFERQNSTPTVVLKVTDSKTELVGPPNIAATARTTP